MDMLINHHENVKKKKLFIKRFFDTRNKYCVRLTAIYLKGSLDHCIVLRCRTLLL